MRALFQYLQSQFRDVHVHGVVERHGVREVAAAVRHLRLTRSLAPERLPPRTVVDLPPAITSEVRKLLLLSTIGIYHLCFRTLLCIPRCRPV